MLGREAVPWRRAKWILEKKDPFTTTPSLSLEQSQDVGPQLPVEESECQCRQSCELCCDGSAEVGRRGTTAIEAAGLQSGQASYFFMLLSSPFSLSTQWKAHALEHLGAYPTSAI